MIHFLIRRGRFGDTEIERIAGYKVLFSQSKDWSWATTNERMIGIARATRN